MGRQRHDPGHKKRLKAEAAKALRRNTRLSRRYLDSLALNLVNRGLASPGVLTPRRGQEMSP
jgi:hypothetical protein